MELPIGLRTAIESGSATLFVGSGIGRHSHSADGEPAPSAAVLAERLAKHFGIAHGGNPDLAKVAQVAVDRKGREALDSFLTSQLDGLEPDATLLWLFSQTWRAIYTTNYDRVIQRAYELIPRPTQRPVSFGASRDLVPVDPRFEVPVLHLHGSLFEGDHRFALITTSDYARFREHRAMLFELLKFSFATSPILYVGYSNQDPNWDMVFHEVESEFSPSRPPESFRVAPLTDPLDQELLRGQGVITLNGDLASFREACEAELGDLRVEPARLDLIKRSVPSDLAEAFDSSPAAMARLLNSWSYVNQEDFTAHPNTTAFLHGDASNWAAIAQEVPFGRDVAEPLYEAVLDAATAPTAETRSMLLLAPAGYGVSTVLMQLALRMASDRLGTVLWHKPNTPFLEGDLEFATRVLPGPVCFLLDNASDAGEALPAVVTSLRSRHRSALFVLGDRLNEWRQRRLRLRPREFVIDPLSDPEIERLLDCLGAHGELGELEPLPRELQRTAIRKKHGKELLVVMREATADTTFDAIVEDEYWSLPDEASRLIYGLVSTLYRNRAVVRDSLIAAALGLNLMEVYEKANDSLQGVVVFETIDEAFDITIARPRHHVIGDVVWSRCLDASLRQKLLLSVMRELNLNYGADVKAFEQLVRSDDTVDALTDIESRVDFFEQACRKDPLSPYVRQHYARMLRRAGRFEAALDQVDAGLGLDREVRVLHHTQGVILADMALSAPSPEVARRRLAQSEAAYNRVLVMNPRDEYGHQGLCELYLGWAQEAPSESEKAEYLRKCEEHISEALRLVRDKEGLWIVSSRVSAYLEDVPGVVDALRNAIKDNPDAVIARYLLGRRYLEQREFELTLETLFPTLKSAPDEYRSALVYAQPLHFLGRELEEAIAHLRFASSGENDARYLATLGGLLFLTGEFGAATQTFQLSTSGSLRHSEINRVEFTPEKDGTPIRLRGIVQKIRTGYIFVRVVGYPDIFCHSSEARGLDIQEGTAVEFDLAFAARGPVAVRVALARN